VLYILFHRFDFYDHFFTSRVGKLIGKIKKCNIEWEERKK